METIFLIIILILSVVAHELAHGLVAYQIGDPTAKYAGRLTLNPLKHLDPIGSVILPLFLVLFGSPILFGWAKPVPVNPYNFRDQKYGSFKVALAGPAVNLIIAVFFGLILRFTPHYFLGPIADMFEYIVYINILLAVFNLIPIPPLDGSHIFFTFFRISENVKAILEVYGFAILLFLLFFFFDWIAYFVNLIFYLITGFALY